MRTHAFTGITYEFVPGAEVIPYLAPHEARRLFGGAEPPRMRIRAATATATIILTDTSIERPEAEHGRSAGLLQFGDSMLPVGAFSFSNGLESAVQQGLVHDADTLRHLS